MREREHQRAIVSVAAIFVAAVLAIFVPPSTARAWGGGSWSGSAPPFLGGTISSAIVPTADNTINLGASGKNFANVFTDVIQSSNSNLTLGSIGGSGSIVLGAPLNASTHAVSGITTLSIQANLLSVSSTTTNAGSGTCTSVTVAGTVLDFTVTATCTAAQTVIVTFSSGFGAAPVCTISSANAAAGGVTTGTPYQSAGSSTSATFTFPAVTAGKYNAVCAL